MAKARSARGVIVDFDHMRIKEQIASRPATQDIRARADFIERKIHRRNRKYPKAGTVAPPVTVEPVLPGTENIDVEPTPIVEQAAVVEPTPVPAPTKQVARPKKQRI